MHHQICKCWWCLWCWYFHWRPNASVVPLSDAIFPLSLSPENGRISRLSHHVHFVEYETVHGVWNPSTATCNLPSQEAVHHGQELFALLTAGRSMQHRFSVYLSPSLPIPHLSFSPSLSLYISPSFLSSTNSLWLGKPSYNVSAIISKFYVLPGRVLIMSTLVH